MTQPGSQVKIKSLNDLLVHIGKVEAGLASWDDVDVNSVSVIIPIAVKGKLWDGRIDARGGAFIKDLQNSVSSVYADLQGERLPSSVLIKAKVKAGSNVLDVDFTEVIKSAFKNMSSTHITAFLSLALLCGTGAYAFNTHSNNVLERDRMEYQQKAQESANKFALDAFAAGKDPAVPVSRYIGKMKKGDAISVAESPYMTKKEAQEKIKRPERADITRFAHCDGSFALLGIDLREELPVLRISQDGVEGRAFFFARVPTDVKTLLTEAVDRSIDSGTPEIMALHADAYFTGNKLEYVIVLGIGSPRPTMTHYTLSDIPRGVKPADAKIPGMN